MFLHVDMDYFFAQIEELRHPMDKVKIIVVCVFSGRTSDSGVVSTVNYAGRALGIRSGMPIALAKKRAPQADTVFLPVDRHRYELVSAEIDYIIRKYSKQVSRASIDEWNLEVKRIPDETARAIRQEVRERTGLTCSVGVAPSLLGAKMAAQKSKPDGLLIVNVKEERQLIEGSDARKVPGIGAKTADALRKMGVQKVRDLGKIEALTLVEAFGRKTGAWLHDISRGKYGDGLEEEKGQVEVSRIGTLKTKTRDSYLVMLTVADLEKEAKDWLRENKKSYKTLTLIFITDDMKTHTKSISFRNPKGADEDITGEAMSLVNGFLKENNQEIRRVGIRFGNFMDISGQTKLF
ncbi:MAG: DNA polymerase IV [Candidatus Micrarchaeota archaeon]